MNRTVRFEVVIPNPERTVILRTIPIDVPVRIEDGMEILTPEAMDMIENTQRENMERKPCPRCGKVEDRGELHAMWRCAGAARDLADILQPPTTSP